MTKVRSAGCGKTTTCVAQRIRLIATIVGRPRHSAWNFRLDDKVLYIDDGDIRVQPVVPPVWITAFTSSAKTLGQRSPTTSRAAS